MIKVGQFEYATKNVRVLAKVCRIELGVAL